MKYLIVLILCFLLSGICSNGVYAVDPLHPVTVEGKYWQGDNGYYINFTVNNDTWNDYLYELQVEVWFMKNAWNPDGWHNSINIREIDWHTDSQQYWIDPKENKSGFICFTSQILDQYPWWIDSYNDMYWGSVTPTYIPEPSSLLALGLTLLPVGIGAMRRKLRR